ncbi:helix-turn-helix domain-containing protein [Butyricicoccus faecihominis]|uniref:helix-turn-helix domain-containing protein n=1 Tax=Butyricicoccus faecihominis TaxID=1712515 RepID=UPI00247B2893
MQTVLFIPCHDINKQHGIKLSHILESGEKMRDIKEINRHIGNEIRKARERAGLTQEQFGELVSLGTKNVSDIERGVAGITVSTLRRICEKLSISSDLIIIGDQGKNDVKYLAERLERLPPAQFAAVESFLNEVFQLFGTLQK